MVRLYWNFYKRLFGTNLVFSFLGSILSLPYFLKTFGVSFVTAGFLLSLLYHGWMHKQEYYFYQNKGISKLQLISAAATVNFLIGFILTTIYYGSHSGG